jgi:4-hydroxybenzoate polyprenyltransferase
MALINVDVELMLIFLTTVIFTLLYFLFGGKRNTKLVLGVIGTLCWMVLGLTYVATDPEFPAVGMLFYGIAVTLVIATIWDAFQQTKQMKVEE